LILNWSSNKLRNDFAAARPTSKQRFRCLDSWYAPIVSLQATKHCLEEKLFHTQLFDTGLETLLKTLLEFGEFSPKAVKALGAKERTGGQGESWRKTLQSSPVV
jgi:hypothetical protein